MKPEDVKLTQEQLDALAPYAHEFKRAIASNYCKAPSQPELQKIREIYVAATGVKSYPANFGCTYCVIQLMKDAGRLYAAALDLKAIEALENVSPDDPLAAQLRTAHEKLSEIAKESPAGEQETAQTSAPKTKTGKGTTAKKTASKSKK